MTLVVFGCVLLFLLYAHTHPAGIEYRLLAYAGVALLYGMSTSSAVGQKPSSTRPDSAMTLSAPAHVSLSGWAETRRLFLFDRFHQTEDWSDDRGTFRHLTPRMDREYALDMLVYQFTGLEEDRWHRADRGLRIKAGSIERSLWSFVTQIKDRVALGGPHTLTFQAWLREDGQANGTLFEVGYERALGDRHHVGVRHTLSQYKADFDLSARYRFSDPARGEALVELTAEDAYNNVIYDVLGVDPEDEDVTRIYTTPPLIARVSLRTAPRLPFRMELHAGWRRPIDARFASQTDSTFRYTDTRSAHYVGATASYRYRGMTAGLLYRHDRSMLDRCGTAPGVSSHYETRQAFQHAGAFLLAERGPLRGELWYALETYTDKQTGNDFQLSTLDRAFAYTEDRQAIRLRGFYSPSGWPFFGLEYAGLIRSIDRNVDGLLTRQWKDEFFWTGPSNYRLNLLVGHEWTHGRVAVGFGFDTDNDDLPEGIPDSPGRFDNVHFRLTTFY